MEKRNKNKIIHESELEDLRYQSFIKRIEPVEGEYPTNYLEVISRQKKIKDETPGNKILFAILSKTISSTYRFLHSRKLQITHFKVH